MLPLVWAAVVCMSCGTAKDDEPQITEACAVLNTADSLRAQGVLIDGIHETDIRLCVLVLIGCSLETIADILPCSPNSVKTLKRRTALKLGTNSRDLRMFLLKMAANMPV